MSTNEIMLLSQSINGIKFACIMISTSICVGFIGISTMMIYLGLIIKNLKKEKENETK